MPTNANSMMSNMPMIPMGYPGAMMMMPQFASPPPPDSDKLRNERKLASRSNPSSKKSDVNKEEAIKRFHSLLSDMEIKADSKWVEILPAIIGDERYTSVKTLAERKVIFQDWKKKKLVEEEEEDNVRSKKAESSFFTMLKESKDIDPNMSMRDIEKMFASDKRFKAVDDKRMRSEIMKNFIKTLLKKDKKKRKDERLKYMDEFDTLIRESSFISYNTD